MAQSNGSESTLFRVSSTETSNSIRFRVNVQNQLQLPDSSSSNPSISTGIPVSLGTVKHYKAFVNGGNLGISLEEEGNFTKITHVVSLHHYYDDEEDEDIKQDGFTPQTLFQNGLWLNTSRGETVYYDHEVGYRHRSVDSVEEHVSKTNVIQVDNTVALNCAEQETTAIKNRMVLCGLTLTIPLFLYLRFTIWSQ